MKKTKRISLLAVGIFSLSAVKAAVAMTDATFGAPVDNQSELLTFEANNSGTTLQIDAIATTTLNGESLASAFGWHLGTDSTTGIPDDDQDAINDAFVTTNLFGLVDGATFSLNTTVNDGDSKWFYIVEHIGNDNGITVTPTSGGTAIDTWSLTLNGADYATITDNTVYEWEGQANDLAGTVFTLADFTGGTGTLSGVDGLIIDGGGFLDPAQIGVASAIPEPSSIVLMGLALVGALIGLRRRK